MIRRPPRSTQSRSSAASDVYKRQLAGVPGSPGSIDGTGSNTGTNKARFNCPAAVAVDLAKNVYVADYFNHTVRKITPAGVVSTLAGLPGVWGSADGTGS